MPIDLVTQTGLSPNQAARLLPSYREGQPTHASRIVRAIVHGHRDPTGAIIKLEAIRFGSQWVTTAEAIQEYAERLAGRRPDSPPRRPAALRRALTWAGSEPETIGV